jgi:hypothetical protein
MRLTELGQAAEKEFDKIKENIPCKGIYNSEQCKEIDTNTLGCALKYYCEIKAVF